MGMDGKFYFISVLDNLCKIQKIIIKPFLYVMEVDKYQLHCSIPDTLMSSELVNKPLINKNKVIHKVKGDED